MPFGVICARQPGWWSLSAVRSQRSPGFCGLVGGECGRTVTGTRATRPLVQPKAGMSNGAVYCCQRLTPPSTDAALLANPQARRPMLVEKPVRHGRPGQGRRRDGIDSRRAQGNVHLEANGDSVFLPHIARVREILGTAGTLGDVVYLTAPSTGSCFSRRFPQFRRVSHPELGGGPCLTLASYPSSFAEPWSGAVWAGAYHRGRHPACPPASTPPVR